MSGSLAILLIDGNHQDRDHYAELLRRSFPNCVVVQATTGRTGLVMCQTHAFDCVVLELDLSDMSGFEVLTKLVPRPQHPEIAVIILTRLYNPYVLDAAIKNGALATLQKSTASGDVLDQTVLKAVSAIPRTSKEPCHFTV
ncbi:MAG TPA: response regulator [Nitrospira sp.]|nr:response regulator [Nitrospira sp.]